ncbi:hypothetical protein ALC62_07494 [Cyphomyrmex costatus]|uniref:Uncharacterized protein n=1 Tax=Cyphomyrmex costatus TaxID=456900 RepID=A0A151IHR7_9HYME|nr:hypothetical protein ALC62_07494 [Cyphomyrmex costatus]
METREYELGRIEQAIREKEQRLKAHENSMRQQLEQIENGRRQLESDRDTFDRQTNKRELELEARERQINKQEQVIDDLQNEATALPPRCDVVKETHFKTEYSHLPLPQGPQGIGPTDYTPKLKVSFREVTESVPYFDGYNIPLSRFTRACRRAREIIPPNAERDLTKLLINKLGHRAYYAVEDEPCDSIIDLIDLLTGAFGPPGAVDKYRGEISTIYMKPKERILDYISRVKDLRTAIIDAERRERRYLDPYFITQIDDLTTRSFIDGLPFEYRIQMGSEARMTHTGAFAAAKAISKRRELDKQWESDRSDARYRSEYDRDSRPINTRSPLTPPTHQRPPRDFYRDTSPRQPDTRRVEFSQLAPQPRENVQRYLYQDARPARPTPIYNNNARDYQREDIKP